MVQSEVSQQETNKYGVLTHTYIYMECRKIVLMNLFAGKGWILRYREWTCGHSGGRRECDEWRK